MKKKLIGLALIGVTTLGVSSVSALTMDLSTFKGYGECKTTGFCDGTNVVIIGHRMYQLNNHDIVLSGPLYTKAQLEYGTTEAPIYYLLDGGEVLQEVGPYKVSLKATPKEQRTMEQIGGYNYKITMIDDVSLEDIEDKDEANDDALTNYVKKLETLVSSYEALDKIEYSEETNTLKFTINKVGLEKKLAEFFTKTEEGEDISILDMFATYLADAIRASYNVDGKTNTSVDIEKGAVELAKSLLLAMAQNNGYKVTNAGELTYGMVANTSATGTFVYETKGLEQTVKYTLEFYYDASEDIATVKTEKDNENDSAVSGVIDGIKLDEYKTTEDQKLVLRNPNGVKYDNASNTLTFDVTRDGLYELLSSFAGVTVDGDGTVLDKILEAFQTQITDDKELDSITFKVNDGSDVTVQAEDGAVEIAKALLLAMANANGSETTDPTQLTYLDVIGTKATATFSYKVPYTKEKAELTYNVEFKYDPTPEEINAEKKEMQEAIDTLFLEDIAEGFNKALTDFKTDDGKQILKSIEYEKQKLTFNINKEGLHSSLASFADLEATVNLENLKQMLEELLGEEVQMQTSGPVHIAELFDFFKELGITKASYEVGGQSTEVNLEDSAESIAAALLKKMAGGNKSASLLEFIDVVGKTGKGKFTFPMTASDKTYEIEYTLEFKYEPNMEVEKALREEAADQILTDYASEVLQDIKTGTLKDTFLANKTKYDSATNTVTFAITEDGLEKNLVNFLDAETPQTIIDVFAKFAEGATGAEYTVNSNKTTLTAEQLKDPISIAKDLLKAMAGGNKIPSQITYKDILDNYKDASAKFTYSVEGTNKTVETEYKLEFIYEKTSQEVSGQKNEIVKQSLTALNSALTADHSNVEESSYDDETKTLTVELKDEAQQASLSDTILKESGDESIVPVVESLMDGAKSVSYKVSTVDYFDETSSIALLSNSFGGTSIEITDGKSAKEIVEDIVLAAAQQVRKEATKEDLKYSDLKNVKIEIQFVYDVPGEEEDATTDYIVEFLYATESEKLTNAKETKDSQNDTVLESMKTQLNTALKNKPTVSQDKDSDGSQQAQIDKAYAALSSIEFDTETNKIEFNVTEEGLTTELSSFLVVGADPNKEENDPSDIPIINMFNQFAKGSNKIEYVIGNTTVEEKFNGIENQDKKVVPSEQYLSDEGEPEALGIMMLAAGLLSDMSTGNVSAQSNIGGMMSAKYNSVVGEQHQATARFYYTDEETGKDYYVEYTLIFNNPTVD